MKALSAFLETWQVVALPFLVKLLKWQRFIQASKPAPQRELKDCSITGIPWSLLKEIVREMVGPCKFEEPGAKTELPYFTGQSKAVLNKIINSWNDLEVYSPNPRLPMFAEVIERERDAFYKGAQASQINLMQNHTIARSLEKEVTAKVDKALKSLSKENMDANYYMKTVTVPYEPGSGATTLWRKIVRNQREDYRCAVIRAVTSFTDFKLTTSSALHMTRRIQTIHFLYLFSLTTFQRMMYVI